MPSAFYLPWSLLGCHTQTVLNFSLQLPLSSNTPRCKVWRACKMSRKDLGTAALLAASKLVIKDFQIAIKSAVFIGMKRWAKYLSNNLVNICSKKNQEKWLNAFLFFSNKFFSFFSPSYTSLLAWVSLWTVGLKQPQWLSRSFEEIVFQYLDLCCDNCFGWAVFHSRPLVTPATSWANTAVTVST